MEGDLDPDDEAQAPVIQTQTLHLNSTKKIEITMDIDPRTVSCTRASAAHAVHEEDQPLGMPPQLV
jgi:hypothetical protein